MTGAGDASTGLPLGMPAPSLPVPQILSLATMWGARGDEKTKSKLWEIGHGRLQGLTAHPRSGMGLKELPQPAPWPGRAATLPGTTPGPPHRWTL